MAKIQQKISGTNGTENFLIPNSVFYAVNSIQGADIGQLDLKKYVN